MFRYELLRFGMTRSGTLIVWSLFASLLAIGRSQIIRTEDYEVILQKGKLVSVSTLRDLNELDLSGIGMWKIEDRAFKNVSVKILNLQSNNIAKLGPDVFSGLDERLEELNLASNNIEEIDSPFVDLKNLKSLNLSDNPVEILQRGAFAGVPKSADIFVKDNRLRMFDSNLFYKRYFKKRSAENEESFARISRSDKVAEDMRRDVTITIENSVLLKVAFPEKGENVSSDGAKIVGNYPSILSLENREIQSVAKNWYQLPIKRVESISLSSNDLRNISKELLNDLPEDLITVELNHNSIREIKNNVLSNDHIQTILLRQNLIEIVEDRAFESVKNLRRLDLTDNKIKDLWFAATLPTNLSGLFVNKNQISEIPDGVFSNLKKIEGLFLESNNISVIKSKAFQGMNHLWILVLSGNIISEIESGALLGISTENREMNDEMISSLPEFSLKVLSLNDNLISDINEETFQGLEKLVELELEGNLLSEIPSGAMKHLGSLRKLKISRNSIVKLQNGVFYGLDRLADVEISIHRNTIEIIQGGIFEKI